MSDEVPQKLAASLAYYRSQAAVAMFSFYHLLDQEEYLLPKYFKPGHSVLDLACGQGRTTSLMHEMGMKVRGVDRSEVFIEIAKQRFPDLDFRVGSYDSIDEHDESFPNILISLNSIDCAFPEAQRLQALSECARVLKPGGILIFSSHNLKSLHFFSPYYGRRLRWKVLNCFRAFGTRSYIKEGSEYLFYTVPQYVVRQAESVGLRLLEIRGFNRFRSERIDRYFSPYLHYVFAKPPE